MTITAALMGTVVKDSDLRTSARGNRWLSVTLRDSDAEGATFVQCSVFGSAAEALGAVTAGEALFVEGTLKLGTYTGRDGQERTGLQLACHRAERPGIGDRKPKKDHKPKTSPVAATVEHGRASRGLL